MFIGSIIQNVSLCRPTDWNIVDIRYCDFRYFRLQDICDIDFIFDEVANLVIDARWDQYVLLCPQLMQDGWYFYQWKEVFPEVATLSSVSACQYEVS